MMEMEEEVNWEAQRFSTVLTTEIGDGRENYHR
jgi:hypothetical protein